MIDTEQKTQKSEAILNLEQAVEQFSQEVRPLRDPTSEDSFHGEKLKSRELAI